MRDGSRLKVYVDGKLAANAESDASPLAAANGSPLRIGFGPHSHFRGKMREVRL